MRSASYRHPCLPLLRGRYSSRFSLRPSPFCTPSPRPHLPRIPLTSRDEPRALYTKNYTENNRKTLSPHPPDNARDLLFLPRFWVVFPAIPVLAVCLRLFPCLSREKSQRFSSGTSMPKLAAVGWLELCERADLAAYGVVKGGAQVGIETERSMGNNCLFPVLLSQSNHFCSISPAPPSFSSLSVGVCIASGPVSRLRLLTPPIILHAILFPSLVTKAFPSAVDA